jgi:hypothetical protein
MPPQQLFYVIFLNFDALKQLTPELK